MKTLALIDVAGIFKPYWEAAGGQGLTELMANMRKRVADIAANFDFAAIAIDSPPYRRVQISEDYKGQREKRPQTELDTLRAFIARLGEDGFPVLGAPGYEADDVIATLVAQALALPPEERLAVTICSSDKDLLQLVNDEANVQAFSLGHSIYFREAEVCAKFGVPPAKLIEFLALTGDASDNINGIDGIGEKTAALIVNSGPGLEGALRGERIMGLSQRLADKIADGRETVKLALRLIALETDAPVDLAQAIVPREPKRAQEPPRAKPVVTAPVTVTSSSVSVQPSQIVPRENLATDWGLGVPIDALIARVEKIREVQSKIMKEGHHYGVIPGTQKPTLLKPGAELLGLAFQLDPQFAATEKYVGDHLESIVICTLFHAPTAVRLGSGMGSCSTRESKYAYRKGQRFCPRCRNAAIIRGREEYGGGWLCFAKAGGCGAKFAIRDPAITGQSVERIANIDIADSYNTVRKMACKRAHVAAILLVTCASEIFTQDVEDEQEFDSYGADPQAQPRPQQHRGAA